MMCGVKLEHWRIMQLLRVKLSTMVRLLLFLLSLLGLKVTAGIAVQTVVV